MENLLLLACPVGMGLMMWFMMKGTGGSSAPKSAPATVDDLRVRQQRIAMELDRAEQHEADLDRASASR